MSEYRAIDNFGKALAKLREFVAMPVENDRDRAGIIQAFEFTFEQCWKALRQIAAEQGMEVVSPRQSLETALQLKLIDMNDETTWLEMLHDRNMTSHLYRETIAREISDRVVNQYMKLLAEAHRKCI